MYPVDFAVILDGCIITSNKSFAQIKNYLYVSVLNFCLAVYILYDGCHLAGKIVSQFLKKT